MINKKFWLVIGVVAFFVSELVGVTALLAHHFQLKEIDAYFAQNPAMMFASIDSGIQNNRLFYSDITEPHRVGLTPETIEGTIRSAKIGGPESAFEATWDLFTDSIADGVTGHIINAADTWIRSSAEHFLGVGKVDVDTLNREFADDDLGFRIDKPMTWAEARDLYRHHHRQLAKQKTWEYMQENNHTLLGVSAMLIGWFVDPILLAGAFAVVKLLHKLARFKT